MSAAPQRVAVVGAGWAGLAAAVQAQRAGHHVTLWEANRSAGGRARSVTVHSPHASPASPPSNTAFTPHPAPWLLDNGQHILIGAYRDTLALMRSLGVAPEAQLLRLPLRLQFSDGSGMALPDWPRPWDALAGLLRARGWTLGDKAGLLRHLLRWQRQGFGCAADLSVATLCQGLSQRVQTQWVEPLCVSALNTPSQRASAQVFLRVLHDALLGPRGSSHLLLPRCDLSGLLPDAALRWLQAQGATLRLGVRVNSLRYAAASTTQAGHTAQPMPAAQWLVNGEAFDQVLWATAPQHASPALQDAAAHAPPALAQALRGWAACAQALAFEAIATVYTYAPGARLPQPLLALHSSATQPAQFVLDRGQLGQASGLWALVVSASSAERAVLEQQVLAQAQAQLAPWLGGQRLVALQTIVEKRATFACTPSLVRPAQMIAPGLLACGDYVAGPYPATLEGAVRSGLVAAAQLGPAA